MQVHSSEFQDLPSSASKISAEHKFDMLCDFCVITRYGNGLALHTAFHQKTSASMS
jgi:hypothetical protein